MLRGSSSCNEGCSRATIFHNVKEEVRVGKDVEHANEAVHKGEEVRVGGDIEHDDAAEDINEEENVRAGEDVEEENEEDEDVE